MAALALMFAFAASAQATITGSSITTPADGSLLFQNQDTSPNQMFTVSGTISGSVGDLYEIDCYQGGTSYASYRGQTGKGIPLTSSHFSVSVPQDAFATDSCELLAVPYNAPPSSLAGYTGPRVGFSMFQTYTVSSGANQGKTDGFYFTDATPTGNTGIDGIDSCGPFTYPLDGTSAMNAGLYLIDCGGSLFGSRNDFFTNPTTEDLTRSEILVDGHNAYGSNSAQDLFSGSSALSGFPALTARVDSFNTSNGDAQTTESEPLVRCSPSNAYAATSSSCTAFAPTGVRITRVTSYTNGGRVATVSDTYSSTDGASHSIDLLYETDLYDSTGGWELPGQSSFAQHKTGDTGAAPASAPGTVYVIDNAKAGPSLANPVGALTFATPYLQATFDNTLWSGSNEESGLFHYQRTVLPSAPVTITWSYATGTTLSEVQAYALAARTSMASPAVGVSSPKSRSVVNTTPVTVKGTASAPSGVQRVVVNGVAAAMSGARWSAAVPLRFGKNTITVTATSMDGTSSQSSETVTLGMKALIRSSRVPYSARRTKIKLACTGPAGHSCKGRLALTERVRRTVVRRVHGKRRRVTVFRTIVIGRSSFSLTRGKTKFVAVGLAKGLSGTIHVRATAVVKGGSTTVRKVTLVPHP